MPVDLIYDWRNVVQNMDFDEYQHFQCTKNRNQLRVVGGTLNIEYSVVFVFRTGTVRRRLEM